jgi:LPXTG-site transpeptidase (sortase) family protein
MRKRLCIFLALAAILICGGIVMLRSQRTSEVVTEAATATPLPTDPAQDTPTQAAERKNLSGEGLPQNIQIPSVSIDLPVKKGFYNAATQKWTLSINSAHFAVMSTVPNTKEGNTYIYGHNRRSVFSQLTTIQTGAEATVLTDKNQAYTYRLARVVTTNPADSSMLVSYSGKPILTLQTCTGALYQNRTLYVFELVGVKNA